MFLKKFISTTTLLVISIIMVVVSANLRWGKNHWKNIIVSDAKGYYSYLPATFIYRDLNLGFFDHIEKEKYYDNVHYYDYRANINGKTISKYYCGTAVLQSPFFLLAHFLAKSMNFDTDGYSKPYALSVSFAALFYLIIGLFFLKKILEIFDLDDTIIAFVITVITFGTNLFYYTVIESGMSHVYSFGVVSAFLFFSKRFLDTKKGFLICASLYALIILIRPINGLVVFGIPFLSTDINSFKSSFSSFLKYHKKKATIGFLVFASIIFIQLLYYKLATGNFIVYSYQQEGFDFLNPHFIDILFSYRKGLFLYTPVYLLSLGGLVVLYKLNKFRFYSFLAFFVLITYVFSSWRMWYYGGSFSSRVFVEYLPFFGILLAVAIQNIKMKWLKKAYISAFVLCVLVCQIQTYQYRYYQIHWSEMNKEKYWDVFLRVDKLIIK